jgi:hypothetical protein
LTPFARAALGSVGAGLAVSVLGGLAGLGLPGAMLATAAMPVMAALWPAADPFPGDSAWPFAIVLSLAWGGLVPVLWLGTRAAGVQVWRRAIAVATGMGLGGAVLAVALYAVSVAPLLSAATGR